MSSHPADRPSDEDTHDVWRDLIATIPEDDRAPWLERWEKARSVERRRRDYSDRWDQSLMGVTRWGQ